MVKKIPQIDIEDGKIRDVNKKRTCHHMIQTEQLI